MEETGKKPYRFFSPEFTQIYGFLDPYKKRFYGTIILSIVQALVFLILPVLAGIAVDIIDNTIAREVERLGLAGIGAATIAQKLAIANAAFQALVGIVITMLISVIALAVIMYVRMWENNKIGNNIIYDLRNALFKSMQSQSYSFYDKNQVGDLVARATSDVNLLKSVLSSELAFFLRNLLQFGLAIVVMLVINPTLTLLSLIVMPFLFLLMYIYRKRMHPLFLSSRRSYGQLTSVVEENVNGMPVVRAFAQEESEKEKFKVKNDDYFEKSMGIAKLQSWFDPAIALLNSSGIIFVIFVGGALAIQGVLSIGQIITFTMLMQFSTGPLRSVGVFLGKLSQINPASQRIVEVLNSESEIEQTADPIKREITGMVEFKQVNFQYPGTNKLVLEDITFKVDPGETVAILGATGSGKTSIINLVPRLYEIPEESGEILIDGVNIKQYDKQNLRAQVGIVAQETFLFSRTIKQNIAIAMDEDEVTLDEVIRAAKLASIHDFIDSLPEKYDTIVGERGVTLSGGQKQRIAIARALLSKPKILILDDATSSVDVDTEYEIQKSFKELFSGRGSTTFIISQRLSTIRMADKILILENGKMEEAGTHEELIANEDGIYYNIYSTLEEESLLQ